MSKLVSKHCVPCSQGTPPLGSSEVAALLEGLDGWDAVQCHHLSKTFSFADFVEALAFVNRLGEVAEAEGHHPDILLAWGKVEVRIWTHVAGGLTENDFILAAKADAAAARG
ncbi:MAG: 4a-hydroxytetrahydrobiopterin dehydratase [Deltaproteobacteria bacterium]